MAPESTTPNTSTEREIGRSVAVPTPQVEQPVVVETSPGGNLTLSFDPSTATPTREGTDLIMETPEGGRVVMSEFFAVGENALPTFTLPDGTVVDATDLLEASGVDLTTAAGPGGGAPGTGGTNYDDNPGDLLAGTDKLGKLGTFWWTRETEPDIDMVDGELVSGTFGLGLFLGELGLTNFMYEDGRAKQHLYGDADAVGNEVTPGELVINTSGLKGSTQIVSPITLSGLPEGATITVKDASGAVISTTVIDASGTISIPSEHFDDAAMGDPYGNQSGVFILPPANSDEDMHVQFECLLGTSSGHTAPAGGTATFVVDAAADLPVYDGLEVDSTHVGHVDVGGASDFLDDEDGNPNTASGWHVSTHDISSVETQTVNVPLEANIIFGDFGDGSEVHYALVQVPSKDTDVLWECKDPDGNGYEEVRVMLDTDGKYYLTNDGTTRISAAIDESQALPMTGEVYFRIPVDTESDHVTHGTLGSDDKMEVKVNVNLTATGPTSAIEAISGIPVKVGGMAEEVHLGGSDHNFDNNVSIMLEVTEVALNALESGLSVTTGWASEGNNDAKHIGGNSAAYDSDGKGGTWTGSTLENDSLLLDTNSDNANIGAPITIALTNGITDENITSITFTVPADMAGELTLAPGMTGTLDPVYSIPGDISSPVTGYTYTPADSTTTTVNLIFEPADGSKSHADVNIGYTVNAQNSSGITGSYTGTTIVVIDAVADKPTGITVGADYDIGTTETHTAAMPGETIQIHGVASFPEVPATGGEKHYVVLHIENALDAGWTLPAGTTALSRAEIYTILDTAMGAPTGTSAAANALDDGTAAPYVLIEVGADGSYSLNLTAPTGVPTDTDYRIWAKPITVVEAPATDNKEYNYENNIAFAIAPEFVLKVAPSQGATVSSSHTYEDNNDMQHIGGVASTAQATRGVITFTVQDTDELLQKVEMTVTGNVTYNSATNSVTCANGTLEVATGYTVEVESNGDGTSTITIHQNGADMTGSGSSFSGIKYVPAADSNDVDFTFSYTVTTTDPQSGHTDTHSGSHTLPVYSVADKPVVAIDDDDKTATYADPGASAAVKGEMASFKNIEMKFTDYTDNSETHFLMVQRVDADATKAGSQTTSLAGGQTIVFEGAGDIALTIVLSADGSRIESMVASGSAAAADLNFSDYLGDITTQTVGNRPTDANPADGSSHNNTQSGGSDSLGNNGTYQKIPVPNEFLELVNGEFTVKEIKITVPDTVENDGTISLKIGGMALDTESEGNTDPLNNNQAYDFETVTFDVGVVTSNLGIEMVKNFTYENGMPREFTPSADGYAAGVGYGQIGGIDNGTFVPGEVAASAHMNLTGLAAGEEATITFKMSGLDFAGDAGVEGLLGKMFVEGANPAFATFERDPVTGDITCTLVVTGAADGADQTIYFLPGKNYDSSNLDFTWTANVKDIASGEVETQQPLATDPPLHVTVDAVANAADLGDLMVDGNLTNTDGKLYGQSGSALTLQVSATFHDNDGSEAHYVLVQIVKGMELSADFKSAFPGYDFADSTNVHYEFVMGTDDVSAAYYKIPVSDDNAYVTNNNGEATVNVEFAIKGKDGAEFEIKTGAMTEDLDSDYGTTTSTAEIGSYVNASGTLITDAQTESTRNNVSIVFNETANVKISEATGNFVSTTINAFENHRPYANLGGAADVAEPAPLALNPSLSLGGNDSAVSGVTVSGFDGRGTVSWTVGGTTYSSEISVTIPFDSLGSLKFQLAQDVYDDRDVTLTYNVTVEDGKSLDTSIVTGTQTIRVDAVAQKPEIVEDNPPSVDFNGFGQSSTPIVTVTFTDVADGNTSHYIYVEARGGWDLSDVPYEIVPGPEGSGKSYWKIDVTDLIKSEVGGTDVPNVTYNSSDDTATVALELNLKAPEGSEYFPDRWFNSSTGEMTTSEQTGDEWYKLPGTQDTSPIQYGGMSRDHTSGDHEQTDTNNWAFTLDGEMEINGQPDTTNGPGFRPAGPAFENDQPLAHLGNNVEMGGVEINYSPVYDGREVTFDYNDAGGKLTANGVEIPAGGSVVLGPGVVIKYVPAPGHSDTDVRVTVTDTSDNEVLGGFIVVVDAVATPMTDVEGELKAGTFNPYSDGKDYIDGTTTVTFEGTVPDFDGSEEHYLLIQVTDSAGNQVDTATLPYDKEYIDGQTYYKVPVTSTDGTFTVDVAVTASTEGDYKLSYGHLSIERPTDGEVVGDNNVSVTLPEGMPAGTPAVEFTVAFANTTVAVSATATEAGEYNDPSAYDTAAPLTYNMTIAVGDGDRVDQIVLTIAGHTGGEVTIDGVPTTVQPDGTVILTSVSHPTLFTSLTSGASVNVPITVKPELYSNKDISITAKVDATDVRSLDTGSDNGKAGTEIDALATKPIVVGGSMTTSTGNASAQDGETVRLQMTVTFADVNRDGTDTTPEFHYVLVESKANWGYPDGFDKAYDASRTEYLKIPVDEAIQNCDPSSGEYTDAKGISYTVVFNPDGTATVTVDMPATMPSLGLAKDVDDLSLKFGGHTQDTPYADSNENILNDVAFTTTGKIGVDIGVVTSTSLDGDPATTDEDVAVALTIAPNDAVDGNESIIRLDITLPTTEGEVWYKDVKVTGPLNFTSSDPFNTADLEFIPANNWSGEFTLEFTATVTDNASGATREGLTGSVDVTVTAVADGADSITADTVDAGTPGVATVNITADFTNGDNDGSETRYILVAKNAALDMALTDDANFRLLAGGDIPTELNADGFYVIECLSSTSDSVVVPVSFSPAAGQPAGSLNVVDIDIKVITKDGTDFSSAKTGIVDGFTMTNPATVTVSFLTTNVTEADNANFTLALAFAGGMTTSIEVPVTVTIAAPMGGLKTGTFGTTTVTYDGSDTYIVKAIIPADTGGSNVTLGIESDAIIGNKALTVTEIVIGGIIDGMSAANLGDGIALTITDDGVAILAAAGADASDYAGMTLVAHATDGTHTIEDSTGTVAILGSDGDDIIAGGNGLDLFGGAGLDTLDYSDVAGGLLADLGAGTVTGGDTWTDNIAGFETFIGSDFADEITVGAASGITTIDAGAGNDIITLDGGHDPLTLLWSGSSVTNGESDVVTGFNYDTLSGGGDSIQFGALFGSSTLDDLLGSLSATDWDADKTLTATAAGTTLTATFDSEDKLLLTMKSSTGDMQSIEVNTSGSFTADLSSFDEITATQVLQDIIKLG